MRLLADISTVVLPKRRVWVNIESLLFVKELPISFTLCKRVQLWLLNKVTREKKKSHLLQYQRQKQRGLRVSWKLCLNLSSCKWRRPRHGIVRYLIPLQLRQLKTLFWNRLINNNKFFSKIPRLAALRRLGSNLFHSITMEKIFEKVIFTIK